MLEKIIQCDRDIFIFLNSLGSEQYDPIWLFITKQSNWIPLFLLFFYIIYKKLGTKQTLYVLFFVALLVAFTDQIANLFKNHFVRLRPCNSPDIIVMRRVLIRDSFSFFSGHAANTMAVAVFLYKVLSRHFKYFGFIFLWPLVFAYSRIYLGLHYPSDIIFGYFMGALHGWIFFKIYQYAQQKYFPV